MLSKDFARNSSFCKDISMEKKCRQDPENGSNQNGGYLTWEGVQGSCDEHLFFWKRLEMLLLQHRESLRISSSNQKSPIFNILHFRPLWEYKMSGDRTMDHLDSEKKILDSESKADLHSPWCSVWVAVTTKLTLPNLKGQFMGVKTGQNGLHLPSLQWQKLD